MPRPRGPIATVLAALLVLAVAVGCSDGSDGGKGKSDKAKDDPAAACKAPPVTMDLEALSEPKAGSKEFKVTDAAARRVPILPGEMAFDPAELSGLESKAKSTPLALYTIYLADFEIPDDVLKSTVTGRIDPGEDQTIGAVTLVPTSEDGLKAGDTLQDGKLDYEPRTALTPLTVTVYGDGDTTAQAYTNASGQATVLALTKKSICVDLDITLENQDQPVYRVKGIVEAPVVRAGNSYFVN